MPRLLAELAQLVGGTLHGDGTIRIERAAPLGVAGHGDITLFDASDRSRRLALLSKASAVVVAAGTAREDFPPGVAAIEVQDLHEAFAAMVECFRPRRRSAPVGHSPQAIISPTARIAADAQIHPRAVIGDDVEIGAGSIVYPGAYIGAGSRLGRDVTVFANAVLYEDVIVGDRTIIHAGAIIGAYGFGYKQVDGRHQLTPQLGYVEIGCDVEIGAGTTIDRGTYGPTVIGEGTKIDDQVQVGHNVRVGRHNLLCAQVGLAGSTTTGDYVVMAGQVGVRDHLTIGDGAQLAAKSGIMYDVAPDSVMVGLPAKPMHEWRLIEVLLAKLPEMRRQIKELERIVAERKTAPPRADGEDPSSRHAA